MTKSSPNRANWHETVMRALEAAPLFAGCHADTYHAMLESGRLVDRDQGVVIARHGETVAFLGVIVEGVLVYSRTVASGKRSVVGYIQRGAPVNLLSTIDGLGSVHDIASHTPSTVLQIDREIFEALLIRDPILNRNVMRQLCRRERALHDWLCGRALLDLRERCALVLLWLADEGGNALPGTAKIPFRLSQEAFAEMVGCTRQAAGKELQALRDEGVIETTYSQFVIVDLDALRHIAGMARPL